MAGEDRSQQATPKRRQDARKRGQVVRSRELTGAIGLLAVVLLAGSQGGIRVGPWRSLLGQVLDSARRGNQEMVYSITPVIGGVLLRWLAMPFALLWSVALFSSIAQGGIVFSPDALQPKWGRLNPVTNLSNLFSMAGLSRMLKSLLPVAVILYVAYGIAQRDWTAISASSRASVSMLLGWMFSRWYEIAWKCGMVLLAWSGVDYFLQRRHLNNSLKMTKQEVTQEMKDAETSSLVRGQIRKRRRELRKRWTMKDVERATAVVTNPQHFAVALEYRSQTMTAPIVVAKGMDQVALRIKEAARWKNIPIVENPPLAQALYRATEVGEAIPAKLYMAVAEILAFLYRTQASLRNSMHAARTAPGASSGVRS
ncbi:MAG: EscU/YscU/HrcU family type III secretion system export apparatus switch protein [Acidobacteriia bacterium]|nr:EscU/YscU/HrcU family type III secretion system export apparatus switch protein [Terriglobia bacterium]